VPKWPVHHRRYLISSEWVTGSQFRRNQDIMHASINFPGHRSKRTDELVSKTALINSSEMLAPFVWNSLSLFEAKHKFEAITRLHVDLAWYIKTAQADTVFPMFEMPSYKTRQSISNAPNSSLPNKRHTFPEAQVIRLVETSIWHPNSLARQLPYSDRPPHPVPCSLRDYRSQATVTVPLPQASIHLFRAA
jgi:hypothetical protein